SDEDVESFDEIGLEPLPRPVGDLQPDEVLGAVAEPAEDGDRNRIAAPGVEREVRGADHRNPIDTEVGGVRGELGRLAGRLGPAVDGDRELVRSGGHEELGGPATL